MKRKLTAALLALCMLFCASSPLGALALVRPQAGEELPPEALGAAEAAAREIDTGYLLREDFLSFATPEVGRGWERVNLSPGATGATSLVGSPNDRTESYMQKAFVPQSE